MHFRSTYCSSQVLTQHIHNKKKTGKAQRASMAQEELQESKLTKAGGRKPTHGCNYPMVGWPSVCVCVCVCVNLTLANPSARVRCHSVILTPMGPSLNLTWEGTSRPSLRSSLSLSINRLMWARARQILISLFSHWDVRSTSAWSLQFQQVIPTPCAAQTA